MIASKDGFVELDLDLPKSTVAHLERLAAARRMSLEALASEVLATAVAAVHREIVSVDWEFWGAADSAKLYELAALSAEMNPATAAIVWAPLRKAATNPLSIGFLNDLMQHEERRHWGTLEGTLASKKRFHTALKLGLSALRGGALQSVDGLKTDEAIIRIRDFERWAATKGLNWRKQAAEKEMQDDRKLATGWKEISKYFENRFGRKVSERTARDWLKRAGIEPRANGKIRVPHIELERIEEP